MKHLFTIKAIERGDSSIPSQNFFLNRSECFRKKFKITLKRKEE
jgi:hypothetical protein